MFASLTITYIVEVKVIDAINELEKQNRKWTERYPVTVMSSAFNSQSDLIDLSAFKSTSYLTTLIYEYKIENHLEFLKEDVFPSIVLDSKFLLKTYSDINHRTQSEIHSVVYQKVKSTKQFKILLIIWAIVVPALISVLEFFSPTWITVIALLYCFWKTYQQCLQMTGHMKNQHRNATYTFLLTV